MKKFTYQVSFFAKNEEEAHEKILLLAQITPINFKIISTEPCGEKPEPSRKNKARENVLKSILDFEKMIHIIKCCVEDETLMHRLATVLGFNNKSKTQSLS